MVERKERLTVGIAFRRQRLAVLTPFCPPLFAGFTDFLPNTATTLLPTIANPFQRAGTHCEPSSPHKTGL